jgi:hypothetical protein
LVAKDVTLKRAILLMTIIATACGSPTSPSGKQEQFAWAVNGVSFNATSNGIAALRAGPGISLYGTDCGRGANLQVVVTAPSITIRTYSISPSTPSEVSVIWTPDARTGEAAGENWMAPGQQRIVDGKLVTGGSGSVTITSISGDWVSGTFNVEVEPSRTNRDTATKTLQGSFELSFRERKIC